MLRRRANKFVNASRHQQDSRTTKGPMEWAQLAHKSNLALVDIFFPCLPSRLPLGCHADKADRERHSALTRPLFAISIWRNN